MNLTFGQALEHIKNGVKMQRIGWNGKNMYIAYVPATGVMYEEHEMLPWIGMKTADNKFVPWLASQTDILANDWQTAIIK